MREAHELITTDKERVDSVVRRAEAVKGQMDRLFDKAVNTLDLVTDSKEEKRLQTVLDALITAKAAMEEIVG